jgi:hypothetical protein
MDGYELAAGVGDGGRHPGSSAMARCSFAADRPCETLVSLGGEVRSYSSRWRVATAGATLFGDGSPHDRSPPEKTNTEGF